MATVIGAAALGAIVPMLAAWIVSLRLRDASIADIVWGPTLIVIAWAVWIVGEGGPTSLALAVLVGAWGLRLAVHIGTRNHGQAEDRRYAALRERDGDGFALRSVWSIFGIQAAIAWTVVLPVQMAGTEPEGLGVFAVVGSAVALIGLAWEAVGDLQLRRFLGRAQPGEVLDTGLWRYSRHPNYFGDALFWWGTWIVALPTGAWWTAIGPIVMSAILVRFTGARLLESDIADRRPAYRAYVESTSAFLPLPRSRGHPRRP